MSTQEDCGPLDGVRIADFTWITAGPTATRLLADLGAEIIKIEPVTGDRARDRNLADGIPGVNRGGHFNNVNRGKLGITLDMSRPEGRELARRLFRVSDATINNFSSGVMDRWGLGYERLRQEQPGFIMVQMAGFGRTGPYRDLVSYGPTLSTLSAFTTLTAYRDGGPMGIGFAYADLMAGMTGALAVLMALMARLRTGRGQYIDLAQFDANVALLETVVLEWSANRRVRRPDGARADHYGAVPHGNYPCVGEDHWCAIAVFDETQWQALLRVLGDPSWGQDERFRSPLARRAHADALDQLLGEATRRWERYDLMARLQAAGVPAGVVQDGEDLLERDPHLRERGFYVRTDHPELGEFAVQGTPPRFSHTPARVRHGAPTLGQHCDAVYGELLGLSAGEMEDLRQRGVIAQSEESGRPRQLPAWVPPRPG